MDYTNYTFEEIEKLEGIEYHYDSNSDGSLPRWYHQIRKKKNK